MVSVCLPSDALLQHLPSYLGFSYLVRGVSLHGCSSKAQRLLLTLDEVYLLTAALPDLQRGIASLGPPVPAQPWLLGRGVGPPGHCPWPPAWGCSSWLLPLASGLGAWGSSSCPPPLAAVAMGMPQRRRLRRVRQSAAERSHPTSEVGVGEAERSYTASEVRDSREEQPQARGQGQRPGGPTTRPRSHGCAGTVGPRGAIPC